MSLLFNLLLLFTATLSDISCRDAYECAADSVNLEFNESSIIECNGYRSCIGNNIIDSHDEAIYCSGYESCRYTDQLIANGSESIYCGSSYSCADINYIYANDSIVCTGYKSCSNVNEITSLENNALCFGILSCMKSTFIDTIGINCYGLASCIGSTMKLHNNEMLLNNTNITNNANMTNNTTDITNSTNNSTTDINLTRRRLQQMNIDFNEFSNLTENNTIYCYSNLSCAACNIEGYDVESYGRSSLAFSYIYNVNTLLAYGILDLLNAVIVHDTSNYSLNVNLFGRYSGYNAEIWCIGQDTSCNINCLGNGCQDLTIYMINNSNVTVPGCYDTNNTNKTQADSGALCPHIEANYTEMFNITDYENIDLADEFMILYDILDESTIGNDSSWDNITDKICLNYEECSMEDMWSSNFSEILYCMGYKSCDKSNWYNLNTTGNIYCNSDNSCSNPINFVLDTPNLICNSYYSCNSNYKNNISNDGNIYCNDYESCSDIIMFNDLLLCSSIYSCNGDINNLQNSNNNNHNNNITSNNNTNSTNSNNNNNNNNNTELIGTVYGLSYESITGDIISNIDELFCLGPYSCINKEISNVNKIYGESIHSLYNSSINDKINEIMLTSYLSGENIFVNTTNDINITCNGYQSCKNSTFICNSNNICNIDCLGTESCLNTFVYCEKNSTCNIACQTYYEMEEDNDNNNNNNETYSGYCPYKVICNEGAKCNFECLYFNNTNNDDNNNMTCTNIIIGNGTVNINDTITKPTEEPTDLPTDIVDTEEPTDKPDKNGNNILSFNIILLFVTIFISILHV